MCGRYALGATVEEIAARFGVPATQATLRLEPRYNVAPGQANAVVTRNGGAHLELMQWGLVPSWSKEPRTRYTTINARVETLESKPAYRKPLRSQRCLVPATGFYEWQVQAGAGGREAKQPYHMQVQDGGLFAFAGLYDVWQGPDGEVLRSYTILTTAANPLLQAIHERMPVILPAEAEAVWLDPAISDPARLLPLLQPYPAERMRAYPVSGAVNSVAHDGAALIAPMPAAGAAAMF
jgi:putative SOS response-associated peptidase YedK